MISSTKEPPSTEADKPSRKFSVKKILTATKEAPSETPSQSLEMTSVMRATGSSNIYKRLPSGSSLDVTPSDAPKKTQIVKLKVRAVHP